MSGWSSDTRLRKFGIVQIGHPPLETRPKLCCISRRNSTTPVVPRRDENTRPEGIALLPVSEGSVLAELLCAPTWWLKVNIGMACPRVWRLGFDRATLCNLVRKRETSDVPALSDDLVFKTILIELCSINSSVVSVLMHNFLCHLTQWLELNRNTFCYTHYEV